MSARTPLYLNVASTLRDEISSSTLIGELPAESSLQERFGVSRSVVRQALSVLEAEGLLTKSQGKQTEVINPTRIHRVAQSLNGLGMQALLQSMKVQTEVHSWRRNDIGELNLRRVRLIDGIPICIIDTTVAEHATNGITQKQLEQHSLHDLLRANGHAPVHSQRSITAIPASKEFATILDLQLGAPLLVLTGKTTEKSGVEIERFVTYHAGSRVALDLETFT